MVSVLRRGARWAIKTRWLPFEARSRLRWRRAQGTWLARRPAAFTDKVQWKMLKDRRPLLTTFADKVAAREFVAKVVGAGYLTECYAVVSDPGELDRSALPREFVAKVSHGCGGLWIVTDDAPADGRFARGERHVPGPLSPLSGWHRILQRPGSLDWDALVEAFRAWLGWNYADVSLEWAYLNIRPRMLAEELLREAGRADLTDYKLFVFDGQARLVQVDSGRHTDHRRNLYLPDWTPLEVEYAYPRPDGEIERPASLGEMIEVAEALGRSVDFVRVDLYDVDGRVVFGELTNYPQSGAGGLFHRPSTTSWGRGGCCRGGTTRSARDLWLAGGGRLRSQDPLPRDRRGHVSPGRDAEPPVASRIRGARAVSGRRRSR